MGKSSSREWYAQFIFIDYSFAETFESFIYNWNFLVQRENIENVGRQKLRASNSQGEYKKRRIIILNAHMTK